ncbi:MAG TPA: hypothetical protein VGM37_17750 [Armatimonadota bacterium]|jgi:Tol biopolymer transport system component
MRTTCLHAAIGAVGLCLLTPCGRSAPVTSRVSAAGAAQAAGHSGSPAISANGAAVAFVSDAADLVSGDTNGANDVFVRNVQTGAVVRASVAQGGAQQDLGDPGWDTPAISASGRYVAFTSSATNLVPGDSNAAADVFVRDLQDGKTVCISLAPGPAPANGDSFAPAISADGQRVAFISRASNLVAADDNGAADAFVYDFQTGAITRVSVASDGAQANGDTGAVSISADGRTVAFASYADNLAPADANHAADILARNLATGETFLVSATPNGEAGDSWSDGAPSLSADGRLVAFVSAADDLAPGDANGQPDVFVRDTLTGGTARASLAPDGAEANDASFTPAISANGRYVTFASNASNLTVSDANGTADVFVRDLWTGQTVLASVATAGTQGDSWSGPFRAPTVTADGLTVAFESWAASLVSGDTNALGDVFARGPLFAAPAFTAADVRAALRAAAGVETLTADQMARLNLETAAPSTSVVDLADAIRLAREAIAQ